MKTFKNDLRLGTCIDCGNYDEETSNCCINPESIYKKPNSWCRKWEKRPDGLREVQDPKEYAKPNSTPTGRLENSKSTDIPTDIHKSSKKQQLPPSKPEDTTA
ncbi:MAG: hypothetical protein M0R80_09765 [Proteobacteria bacterium]|jgi:hypothetical protein|nr:hypothetical protein [Pseudomonadota bacterium]